MNKIRAIIVDDESNAREVLASLLENFCEDVEVIAACNELTSAIEQIVIHQPDLVFLDIQMPIYAGYEIVDFFEEIKFDIVFTTAYEQYALKAFEVSAIDYLLKPLDIESLQKTVKKVRRKKMKNEDLKEHYELLKKQMQKRKISKITILEKDYRTYVDIEKIVAFEGQASFSKVFLSDGSVVLYGKNLKQISELLDQWPTFFRIHKSWIINAHFLEKYFKNRSEVVLESGLTVKVSRSKVSDFESFMLDLGIKFF